MSKIVFVPFLIALFLLAIAAGFKLHEGQVIANFSGQTITIVPKSILQKSVQAQGEADAVRMDVRIFSPEAGQILRKSSLVRLKAKVNGIVAEKVEFYVNGVHVSTRITPPYEYDFYWKDVLGQALPSQLTESLEVKAIDSDGTVLSDKISVIVN